MKKPIEVKPTDSCGYERDVRTSEAKVDQTQRSLAMGYLKSQKGPDM